MKPQITNSLWFAQINTDGTSLACSESIMNKVEIIFVILAIAVVALDVIVRLVIAPHRRDKFLETLLDSMTGPEAADSTARAPHAAAALDDALAESLLRHFEHSAISRRILAALTADSDGIRESEVFAHVNRQLAHVGKRALPAAVVRRVVIMLMRADLVTLRGGRLELTTGGKRLHALLEVRSTVTMPAPSFVSP